MLSGLCLTVESADGNLLSQITAQVGPRRWIMGQTGRRFLCFSFGLTLLRS